MQIFQQLIINSAKKNCIIYCVFSTFQDMNLIIQSEMISSFINMLSLTLNFTCMSVIHTRNSKNSLFRMENMKPMHQIPLFNFQVGLIFE